MFQSCRLGLSQSPSNGPARWLQVVLFNPKVPQATNGQTVFDYMKTVQRYPWRGSWRSAGNSFSSNNKMDFYYTLGTMGANRFWRWSAEGVLEFVDRIVQPGGNAETGADLEIAQVTVSLYGARLTGRGFQPVNSGGTGRGMAHVESHMFRAGFPITWEWAVNS